MNNIIQSQNSMKNLLTLLILLYLSNYAYAQRSLEMNLSVGGTFVDIDAIIEEDEIAGTFATDWSTFNYGLAAQFIFAGNKTVGIGAELMYQYLYWYSVSVPFGSQRIYREYDVSCTRITPFIRLGSNSRFSLDLGPELNFIDGMTLGFLVSGNLFIPVSEKVAIPIKLRADIVQHIGMLYPLSLNTGLRVNL